MPQLLRKTARIGIFNRLLPNIDTGVDLIISSHQFYYGISHNKIALFTEGYFLIKRTILETPMGGKGIAFQIGE